MDMNGINHLLAEMRTAAALAEGREAATPEADFGQVMQASLDQVNQQQQQAQALSQAFEAGNANVEEVMVALQKANLSFQTMIQVRNKLVNAYQEIMNLQV